MVGRGSAGYIANMILQNALKSSGGIHWPGGELEARINAKLNWNGPHFVAAVGVTSMRMLDLTMIHLVNEMKNVVSVPNPSGDTPSQPGEPPRKVSGDLQRGLGYKIDHVTSAGFVTVNGPALDYWAALEYGTRNMAPRPYIRTTLARVAPALAHRIGIPRGELDFQTFAYPD